MQISPGRSKSRAPIAACGFARILQRRILYCGAAVATLLACLFGTTKAIYAQEERPQITPGERRPAKKKDSGPRALGVVQLSPNGKASLIPIAILVNGKFWDASAYKADPIPMSLDSGVVYEAERSGNSLGLFTVGSALHSNSPIALNPWIGTGTWHPTGTESEAKPTTSDVSPVGIEDADAAPRLTRDPEKLKQPASAPSGSGTSSKAPSDSASKPTETSSNEGPPRLSKGSASSDAPQSGQTQPASSPPSSTSKPSDTKSDDRANGSAEHTKVPPSDSGASSGDRPVLRRGRPAESFADEDVPGYSKAGASIAAAPSGGKLVESNLGVQYIPAISDATGPPPHSLTFEWLKGEEGDRRTQMMALAKDQLRAYLAAHAKNRITAKPTHPATVRRVKPEEPIFDDFKMIAYDLWNSNQPIIVVSAQAHLPPPPAGAPHSDTDTDLQYSIMLVAYPDIYNNLHKLYSGVTDKFHLDVTPRLDLIDAIDADGDGRGELLFRETSDVGTGWIVYRATADKLWKIFDSLNPQS
jgi:hypothetical protein